MGRFLMSIFGLHIFQAPGWALNQYTMNAWGPLGRGRGVPFFCLHGVGRGAWGVGSRGQCSAARGT